MQNNRKTVLVTGGSRGIGKAIVNCLIKADFDLFVLDRLINVPRESNISYFQIDLTNKTEVEEFVRNWNRPVNALINNAGICGIERLDEELNLWESILNTNLNGLYYLTKGLLRWIPVGGRIVNISSQLGFEGRAGFGAYCATKHALLGLTKCWAKELGEKKITVNAICPGWVKTEMAMEDIKKIAKEKNMSEDDYLATITKDLDLKRFVEPEEVADLVSFLVSDQARAITGQAIPIR